MKTVDFSETIVACDLKVGRCRQIIELMKYSHFLTLAQCHLHMKIKTCFSQKLMDIFKQILYVSL